jgi:hypothetical protein
MLEFYSSEIDEVKIASVDYKGVQFLSQINYHLDQMTQATKKDTIDQMTEQNKTSVDQLMQISRSQSVNNDYTWSVDQGFSIGVSVSANIQVPFVGGLDTSVQTSYTWNQTKSQTESKSRTWDFSQAVTVPPQKKVAATLMLEKTRPRIPFDLTCTMIGYLDIHARGYKNGKYLTWIWWGPSIADAFAQKPSLANFSYSGNTLYFKSSGTFEANEEIKATIALEESSLINTRSTQKRTIDALPKAPPHHTTIQKAND